MSTERDFDRIAAAWLAIGPDELPERVLDTVATEIHHTGSGMSCRCRGGSDRC